MKKGNSSKTDLIVSSMLQIYDFLRSKGDLDPHGEMTNFLHWDNYQLDVEQRSVRDELDLVLRRIKEHNPQISAFSIYQSLLFKLTQQALWIPDDFPDVEAEYRRVANGLLNYDGVRIVKIPIINLEVGEKPVKFGLVTFMKIKRLDKKGPWWDAIEKTAGEDQNKVYSYAQVRCPGDYEKSLEYAIKVTSETLTILRAIGFPFGPKFSMHFGLINEYPVFQTRPFYVELIHESFDLQFNPPVANRIGPGVAQGNLRKDIFSSVKRSTINRLQRLIEKDMLNPGNNKVKRKFFLGLHWLGESTKPDTIEARFAKLAFALEAFIGGDSDQDNLSTRGLKATLAERGAFIAGSNPLKRREIHDMVNKSYGIRGGIVHGGGKQIEENELVEFSSLVRNIAWALLEKIDSFTDVNSIQEWVFQERYS